MKRLFISQPFHGRGEEEIFRERENIEKIVRGIVDDDIEVIDQYHQDAPEDANRLFFLGNSIKLMGTADIVCFVDNWETAKGCAVEMKVCKKYNIPHIILADDGTYWTSSDGWVI